MIVYLQLIDTAEDRSKFEQLYEQYKQLMIFVVRCWDLGTMLTITHYGCILG